MKGANNLQDFGVGQVRSVVNLNIGLLLQALKPNRMDRSSDQNFMHENEDGGRVNVSTILYFPKIRKRGVVGGGLTGANKSGTFEKSLDKWAESVSDWGFYAERREKGRAWIHQKRKHLR